MTLQVGSEESAIILSATRRQMLVTQTLCLISKPILEEEERMHTIHPAQKSQ